MYNNYLFGYLKIRDSIIDGYNNSICGSKNLNIYKEYNYKDQDELNFKINRLMNFLYYPNDMCKNIEIIDCDFFDESGIEHQSRETSKYGLKKYDNNDGYQDEDYDYYDDDDRYVYCEDNEKKEEEKEEEDEGKFTCFNSFIYINNIKYGKIYNPNFKELLNFSTQVNEYNNCYKIINGNNINNYLVVPFIQFYYSCEYSIMQFNYNSSCKHEYNFKKLHIIKKTTNHTHGYKLEGIKDISKILSDTMMGGVLNNKIRYVGKLFIPIGSVGDEIEIKHNTITNWSIKLGFTEIGMISDSFKYSMNYCILPDNDITIYINSNNQNEYIGLLEYEMLIDSPYILSALESSSTIDNLEYRSHIMKIILNEFSTQINLGKQIGIVTENLYTSSNRIENLSGLDLYWYNSLKNHFGENNIKVVTLLKSSNTSIINVGDVNDSNLTNVLIFSNLTSYKYSNIALETPNYSTTKFLFISLILVTNENYNNNNKLIQLPYSNPKRQKLDKQHPLINENKFKFSNLLILKIIKYSINEVKDDPEFYSFCQGLHLVCKHWNYYILSKIKFIDFLIAPNDLIGCYLKFKDLLLKMSTPFYESTLYKYSTTELYSNTMAIHKLLFEFYYPDYEPDQDQIKEYTLYDPKIGYLNLNNPTTTTSESLINEQQVIIYNLKDELLKIINNNNNTIAIILQYLYVSDLPTIQQLYGYDSLLWELLNQTFNNNSGDEFELNISTYLTSKNKIKKSGEIDKFIIINGDTINYRGISMDAIKTCTTTSTVIETTPNSKITTKTTTETTTEITKSTIFFKNPTFSLFTPIYYKYKYKKNKKSYENVGCFSAITINKKINL